MPADSIDLLARLRTAAAAGRTTQHERMLGGLAAGKRHCSRCGRDLPLAAFYPDPHTPSGYRPYCRTCTTTYQLALRKRRPAAVRAPARLDPMGGPRGWADRAACRRHPRPDVFFASENDRRAWLAAIAVCTGCPVREPCLAYALQTPALDGIWGGTTAGQRKGMRRKAAAS